MTTPVFPPMPVVLSPPPAKDVARPSLKVGTAQLHKGGFAGSAEPAEVRLADVEGMFGAGSEMARVCRLAIEGPPVRHCACGRTVNGTYGGQCGDCWRLSQRFLALCIAFSRVAECIEVVETRAAVLFVSDVTDEHSLTEWRALAFAEVAEDFAREPWPTLRREDLDDEPGDDS